MALPIEEAGNAIAKIWHNERTTFVWVMFAMLIFVCFLVITFLNALETKDARFTSSLDKVTEALNRNTEAMIELKNN